MNTDWSEGDIDTAADGMLVEDDDMNMEEASMGMEEVEVSPEVDEMDTEEPEHVDTPIGSPALGAAGSLDTPIGSTIMESNSDDASDIQLPAAMEFCFVELAEVALQPQAAIPPPSPSATPAPAAIPAAVPNYDPQPKYVYQKSKVAKSRLLYWIGMRPNKPNKPQKRCANMARAVSNSDQPIPSLWLKSVCRATFVEWEDTGFVRQFKIPHIPWSWTSELALSTIDDMVSNLQHKTIEDAPSGVPLPGQGGASGPAQVELDMDEHDSNV